MPKQMITQEQVIETAFQMARARGLENVGVKDIAKALGTSVQPIYTYCQSMEQVRKLVEERNRVFIREFIGMRIDPTDIFASTGKAYMHLASEEPHLLQIFVFQQRENISSLQDMYQKEASVEIADVAATKLGISREEALALHLHMLIYSIGLGVILSTSVPGIPLSEASKQQEEAYKAFSSYMKGQGKKV